ncbi:MAG TPA: xanthine dehydrogenase family protein molybdopterin-binding subunit, partial [Chloroflexota bacterium]
MAEPLAGQSIKRVEDEALLRGAGRYTDDFSPPGTLHLALARSPYPKATITRIDTTAAQQAPGVVAVLTGEDMAGLGDIPTIPLPNVKTPPHPILCRGYVAAAGAPVAAVAADTAAHAEDGAALVEVYYNPQPSVAEPEAALESGAPKVFDELEDNVCYTVSRGSGGVDKAIAEADKVVRLRIDSPRLAAIAMEPRATLAVPEGFGRGLTVYSSTQAPHSLRLAISQSLHLPENQIRVIAPDVGGGFGSKGGSYREDMLAAHLALKLRRPVKFTATRGEDLATTIQGRDMAITAELAAKADGTLTAFRIRNIANLGAYLHSATALPPMFMLNMAPGCYKIPAVSAEGVGVFTNTTSTGPYRGAGRPEAVLMIERIVDQMAHELGIDQVEIRRKNFIQPSEFPYQTSMGVSYDSGDYGSALDRALGLANYGELVRQRDERRAKGELVGIGLSTFVEPSGGLGFESGVVRVERSGTITVVTGSSSHGQGHETVYAQLVADLLHVPLQSVRVLHGDTEGTPIGTGTFGSRSLMTGGPALMRSAEKVIDKAKKVAAEMLEASPADVELADGGLAVAGTPDKTVPWARLAMRAYNHPPEGEEPGLEATSYFDTGGASAWGFGAHLVMASISRETGRVTIERLVAVDDCGRVLNPMIVEGQVVGGIVQALGQALLEQVVFGEDGQTLTGTLMDYAPPRTTDVPSM